MVKISNGESCAWLRYVGVVCGFQRTKGSLSPERRLGCNHLLFLIREL